MRLGQTSIIHFASRFVASASGFAATVFIGRILGSGGLGTYYLILSLVAWLGIAVKMGVPSSITKRISEGTDDAAYAVAGTSISILLFVVVSALVLLFREQVNEYIGHPAAVIVVLFLGVNLAQSITNSVLRGQHLVHISGVFTPIRTGSRSIVQIIGLLSGLGLTALYIGYTAGYVLVALFGLWVALKNFQNMRLPNRKHYRELISYAKFSWIGSLRSRAFNWVDVTILGFFVSQSVIGIYTAAWNISVFLILFGGSLSQTLFPEMSSLSADEDSEAVADLFETALAFSGLILIPGLIGGTLLGEQLLRIYGDEFSQGGTILSVLIVATLIQGYQRQFTTTLNALDKPEIAFRINAVFIAANVILNLSLIPYFQVIGAAAATATAVAISLVAAHYMLSSLIDYSIPFGEIARQWGAAAVMGVVVALGRRAETTYIDFSYEFVTVLILVILGAGVYSVSLFALSGRFRKTVIDNLPSRLSQISV
ncbi:lipopolysaccharide biosynthesis protein [Halolamina litorea]|uniref:Polysaccharide biosynthesis C-terminal domain-containing protein n=1 Tax=Halolamina litorea TaxID=1515593 RepID=A0ABD6BNB3_9EURY|nr:polysaccharide biosynthesis C-terminal domain-containing protein [Halolamina litorea]